MDIMRTIIKRFIFKGTAVCLWIYFIYSLAGFGIGLSGKYGIGNSQYTFFWLPFMTTVIISGLLQIGLYSVHEASISRLHIRIICFISLMPTFLFTSISLFSGLYEIIFQNNILLDRFFILAELFIWGIYLLGIITLFSKNSYQVNLANAKSCKI